MPDIEPLPPPPTDPFAELRSTASSVAARVEDAMRDDLQTALAGCDPLLVEVVHYALFNGGKRIRPLLTVLCSRCCGRDDDDLYLLAGAFEYLHVATLVHDDVIDRALQRRGKETVIARYDITAAILAGDWLHARSMYLIGRLVGPAGLEIFCQATLSMVNGEFEQLRQIGNVSASEHHYFSVIRQKTGNLIASTCAIGGLFAGADHRQRQALAAYGDHIGAAFQVVDDLLDFKGDAVQTGKQTGNDFVEGKITLPLLSALAQANQADRQAMEGLIQGDRTRPQAYLRLMKLIDRYNGFDLAANMARGLVDQAVRELDTMTAGRDGGESLRLLRTLASYLLARKK
jgi:octaprenyl-diphosphate synthase